MAITDVPAFAHLTDADIDNLFRSVLLIHGELVLEVIHNRRWKRLAYYFHHSVDRRSRERVRDVGVRERITMAGGRLVPLGDSRNVSSLTEGSQRLLKTAFGLSATM